MQYVESPQSQQLLKDLSLAICLKIRQPLASRALGQWDTLSCVRYRHPTSGSRRVIMTSIINSFAGSTSIPSATVSSRCKWTVYTQSWQSASRYCYFASRLHFRINSLRCALCTESWLITFCRKCTLLICYHWKILIIMQNYHFHSVYSLTCFNTMFFKHQVWMQVV